MGDQIDTGTDDLLASLDAGVLTLTLNRPEARNAMSGGMTAGLASQLASAELDPNVKAIVLTGAGKGFCAVTTSENVTRNGSRSVWAYRLRAVLVLFAYFCKELATN